MLYLIDVVTMNIMNEQQITIEMNNAKYFPEESLFWFCDEMLETNNIMY